MGAHLPLATMYPDLHVPSSFRLGSMSCCAAVGARNGDVGRVGSEAHAAVLTRAQASMRRVTRGIEGSKKEERHDAAAV
jgi:hypothetical protein